MDGKSFIEISLAHDEQQQIVLYNALARGWRRVRVSMTVRRSNILRKETYVIRAAADL
jgi:hypothetical protein